jgi:hypothetical protein
VSRVDGKQTNKWIIQYHFHPTNPGSSAATPTTQTSYVTIRRWQCCYVRRVSDPCACASLNRGDAVECHLPSILHRSQPHLSPSSQWYVPSALVNTAWDPSADPYHNVVSPPRPSHSFHLQRGPRPLDKGQSFLSLPVSIQAWPLTARRQPLTPLPVLTMHSDMASHPPRKE